MKKRVVITGMDLVSCIGIGLESFWEAAVQGKSGIKRIQSYDPSPYPTQIGGEISPFFLSEHPEFNQNKRYPRAAQYALYCTHHAIRRAGLEKKELEKASTYIGTSLGGMPELESAYRTFFSEGWKKVPPLSVIRGMPNSIANHVAIAFGLKGANLTFSNACVSSAAAIGHAYRQISQGEISLALCGGTESLVWETMMAAWCKLRVMSRQNECPEEACRPFDKNRDGMVMADGAGMLVLEELEHAQARGAKIEAEIIGFGESCDAFHVTMPQSEGQVAAIEKALSAARMAASDVQYINAHGTGTKANDTVETQTFKAVFGEQAYSIPITAQKAMTGHAIGASGAMELIATTLSLKEGLLLPTMHLTEPDPHCDLDYIPNCSRKKDINLALSTHFAFGGANAAFILRRF